MRNLYTLVLLFIGSIFFVGCGASPTEVLPTLASTAQPAVEASATTLPTNAPTPTELQRATLPPTWTPSPVPTETSIPPTNTTVPTLKPVSTLVGCATFVVDRERSPGTFVVGQPLQVYWSLVEGASRYRIVILDELGAEIFAAYSVEPTFIFEPDQFEPGKRYIWTVYPEDGLRQQMCIGISGELSPE